MSSLPKPYYDRDGITIFHGDALDIIPVLSRGIACVLTDPPYASGARTEAAKPGSGAMLRGERWASKPIENDQMTTPGFIWLLRQIALDIKPMLNDGAAFLSFIDWRQWPNLIGALETANLRVNGMVVWDKQSYGLGNGFRVQHELICYASKGSPRIINRGIPNVIQCVRDNNEDHPSPKPVALIQKLLQVVAETGDLVVDPFMGAGSTLRAARNLGLQAIGIEIEERYCEIAVRRLQQSVMTFATEDES
jgi:site-specific DNA-methyltransferase (adenine-specific)